jgi:hypothetical protein
MLKKYDLNRSSSAEEGLDQAEFAWLLMQCEFAPVELQQCWKKCIDGWRSSCEAYLPTKLYELLNKVWGKAAPLHARALACARPCMRAHSEEHSSDDLRREIASLAGWPTAERSPLPPPNSRFRHTPRPILGFVSWTSTSTRPPMSSRAARPRPRSARRSSGSGALRAPASSPGECLH